MIWVAFAAWLFALAGLLRRLLLRRPADVEPGGTAAP